MAIFSKDKKENSCRAPAFLTFKSVWKIENRPGREGAESLAGCGYCT